MKKKVLVTGANGQLGQTIKELYLENDLDLDFVFVSKAHLDITKKDDIDVFFENTDFKYCINCAAYTNVEQAEKSSELAYEVNAKAVRCLAEACKKREVILIHISTDYVFDGEKNEAYTIFDKVNPINEYGKSKLLGEVYIQETLKEFFIVRTSWLYSKVYGKNFYRIILEKAKTEKELRITNEQKGCPTDTVNLAKYLISFISNENKDYRVYHFCDEKVMTWFDFAKQILSQNNLSGNINLVEINNYRTFAKRPKNSILYTASK